MITGMELLQALIIFNVLSLLFQAWANGVEFDKQELASIILFIPLGLYFLNTAAAEYERMRSEDSGEEQLQNALNELKDSMNDD